MNTSEIKKGFYLAVGAFVVLPIIVLGAIQAITWLQGLGNKSPVAAEKRQELSAAATSVPSPAVAVSPPSPAPGQAPERAPTQIAQFPLNRSDAEILLNEGLALADSTFFSASDVKSLLPSGLRRFQTFVDKNQSLSPTAKDAIAQIAKREYELMRASYESAGKADEFLFDAQCVEGHEREKLREANFTTVAKWLIAGEATFACGTAVTVDGMRRVLQESPEEFGRVANIRSVSTVRPEVTFALKQAHRLASK